MPIARAIRAIAVRIPRGQSLVEFALILPVLLLLLGGAIDLGRLFYAQVAISNAAKEGAFYGATNPTCDQPRDGCTDPRTVSWHIEQEATGLTPLSYTVECLQGGASVATSDCVENDTYRVSVGYPFRLATPLLSGIFGSSVQLHATASAVVLNQAFDASATPIPMSTATPTPTPVPGSCTVPDFIGTKANSAAGTWSATGFTGSLTTDGNGNFTVVSQSLAPGSSQPCSSDITVSDSSPTPTPAPTATPSPAATPTPTPYATPTPTPSCLIVPNLVGMTVSDARTAWADAGFTGGFSPSSGHAIQTVTNQVTTPSSAPGQCIPPTASVTVSY